MDRKTSKGGIALLLAGTALIASGCGKTLEDAAGAASSITISGTVATGGALLLSNASHLAQSDELGLLAASQCSDGNYYVVRCVSLGETAVSGDGAVSCGGGSDGGFSIAGMPINEAIGCFIRRSTDGTSYSTLGTIEFDAATLSGTTGAVVGTGDLKFNVAVSTSGVITATIDSSTASNVSSETVSGDPTTLSGIYDMKCASVTGDEVFDSVLCKCDLHADQYYPSGGMGPHAACEADNAALVPSNAAMKIDINIYHATTTGFEDIPAGDLYGVTVWDATGGTSKRGSGGEGLPNFGGTTTWTSAQATTAVAWDSSFDSGAMTGIAVGAIPAANANAGAWQTWIRDILLSAKGKGWDCSMDDWQTSPGAIEDNPMCLQEFLWSVYGNGAREKILPRVYAETRCASGVCPTNVNSLRVYVEGIDFNYSSVTDQTASVASITPGDGGIGASPGPRYVIEQWVPIPGGGGTFRAKREENKHLRCVSDSTSSDYEFTDSACPTRASNNYKELRCRFAVETRFTFIPNGTNALKGTFESRQVPYGPDSAGLDGITLADGDAWTVCSDKVGVSESVFKVEAAK